MLYTPMHLCLHLPTICHTDSLPLVPHRSDELQFRAQYLGKLTRYYVGTFVCSAFVLMIMVYSIVSKESTVVVVQWGVFGFAALLAGVLILFKKVLMLLVRRAEPESVAMIRNKGGSSPPNKHGMMVLVSSSTHNKVGGGDRESHVIARPAADVQGSKQVPLGAVYKRTLQRRKQQRRAWQDRFEPLHAKGDRSGFYRAVFWERDISFFPPLRTV